MNRLRALYGTVSVTLLTLPLTVSAQGAGIPSKIVPCDGVNCTVCDLATLAQNIINTGIFITVFLSALLFAYAGFLYVTNEALEKQKDARNLFKNVAIGLAIILAAWLVVDTLMKSMLGGNFGPWNDICRAIGL